MKKTKKKLIPNAILIDWLIKEKLTSEQFAQKVGLSYHAVTKWRSGKNKKPILAHREKIKKVFPHCPLVEGI